LRGLHSHPYFSVGGITASWRASMRPQAATLMIEVVAGEHVPDLSLSLSVSVFGGPRQRPLYSDRETGQRRQDGAAFLPITAPSSEAKSAARQQPPSCQLPSASLATNCCSSLGM
jgi:hypothetical protein